MHAQDESNSCSHPSQPGAATGVASGKTADLVGKYICPMCPGVAEDEPVPCPHCGMALERVQPVSFGQPLRYTCPMHPEVVQDGPGDCPVCGMALEPADAGEAGLASDPEYLDMRRRFIVASALAVPLLFLAMGDMLPGEPMSRLLGHTARPWLELLLATPICLWAGWPFLQRAWSSIRTRHLNMFTLIGLGVGVAYCYSLVATLVPGLFPAAFRDAGGQVQVYFEAAGVIVALVLLGQVLELRARSRTDPGPQGDALRA